MMLTANIPEAGYGKKVVLRNISFSANAGEIVSLIGPNGAGKSTLLKVLMGILKIPNGSVFSDGVDITNRSPEDNVKAGISMVPQGNRVFTELTVRENLEVGGYLLKSKQEIGLRIQMLVDMFPDLKERLQEDAGKLSGGEKQQLALARALMLQPEILLMDEPSLGLAPKLVTRALDKVKQLNSEFRTTVIVVEQKVREVLSISERVYALRMGEVVFQGAPSELRQGDRLQKIFLT